MANKRHSNKPRGFFRTLLALSRVLRATDNLDESVEEAGIVQMAFNRSKWGKKVARWDLLAEEVAANSPEAAQLMKSRVRMGTYDLDKLIALPVGTLGHTFATIAKERGIDPNLIEPIDVQNDADWLLAWTYETHDLWHLMTGNYYDEEGEFGVGGFYMGQMPNHSFILFFTSLVMLRTVWNDRAAIGTKMRAFNNGYEKGVRAKCLIGLDWNKAFERNLDELREEWGIEDAGKIPPLALAA